jgi:hypothetical protein
MSFGGQFPKSRPEQYQVLFNFRLGKKCLGWLSIFFDKAPP